MPRATQMINGREYVYEYKSVWNKEKQRSEQQREYLGRVIDGAFVPNKKRLLKKELDQARGLTQQEPEPVPQQACRRDFFGATYLLDQIGEHLGVEADMRSCFPGMHKELLSLSYYLALEPTSPLYRFKRWAASHEHPCGRDIPSQRSSELLPLITEGAKTAFLRKQSLRRMETDYLFYDSTSVSSYAEQLKQVKWGKNKEGDNLAQINLALLLGQHSGLPAYYRKLPGDMTDVMTINTLLAGIEHLDVKKVKLVLDKGFCSAGNINELFTGQHAFILAARNSLSFIQDRLKGVRTDFDCREHYNAATGLFLLSQTLDWPFTETQTRSGEKKRETRRLHLHIYYNVQQAADEKIKLNRRLDALEEEIRSGKRQKRHAKQYAQYFDSAETPERGIRIQPKQAAINETLKNAGFFVLLSNEVSDPAIALNIYRAKDLIEKSFSDLKGRLNMRRALVSSEENLEGKLFLQFVGLIYLSYVKQAMDKAGLFKNYTMQELFDELDVIERFRQPGRAAYYSEITEKQRRLYAALGVQPPA